MLLILAGTLVRAIPAHAIRYMSDAEAYEYVLGEGLVLTAETRVVDAVLSKNLEKYSGLYTPPGEVLEVQVARKDNNLVGYALMLTEKTRYRPITFAVGIGPDGRVLKTVVVVYREPRGEQVKAERFNAQYTGKSLTDNIRVGSTIRVVSGATVSAEVMTSGVKKALYLVDQWYLAPHAVHASSQVEFAKVRP